MEGKDVRGIDPEVRPKEVRRLMCDLASVRDQLILGHAPGEVGIGLLETSLTEGMHHRRARKCFREEDDLGMVAIDRCDQLLPEMDRLGMRIIDAKECDPLSYPVLDDAKHLGEESSIVVVEVDRVDVLVLLRWILSVCDRAIGAFGEELLIALDPGMVGRCL